MPKLTKRERAIAQATAQLVTPDGDGTLSERELTLIEEETRHYPRRSDAPPAETE